MLSEFNCTLPGIEPICDELMIKQICIDDVAKKKNAELIPFNFDTRKEDGDRIIDELIEAYKNRRGKVKLNLLPEHGNKNTLTGVSELSLKKFLGDSWKPLIDLIVSGKIKGVAGVVGCSSVAYGHDTLTVTLTKELIARDINRTLSRMLLRRNRKLRSDDSGSGRACRTGIKRSLQDAGNPSGVKFWTMSRDRTPGDGCDGAGKRNRHRYPAASSCTLSGAVAGRAGARRRMLRTGSGTAAPSGRYLLSSQEASW